MSREISHTQDAWTNVRERLSFKPWIAPMRKALVFDDVCQWRTDQEDERTEDQVIKEGVALYKTYDHQQLVAETMNRIRDHRTCSNGGHEFYLDREGWYSVSCDELPEYVRKNLPYWTI